MAWWSVAALLHAFATGGFSAVASSMIERRRGAIINVVSFAGRNGGGSGAGPYAAAKGGLITYTKSLAKELAPYESIIGRQKSGKTMSVEKF